MVKRFNSALILKGNIFTFYDFIFIILILLNSGERVEQWLRG